jgi:signal transduction histidine kinase
MKIKNISRTDIIYVVGYLFFATLLVSYVFFDKKNFIVPTYIEIPKEDKSLLLNDTSFSENNLNVDFENSKNIIDYSYHPVQSIKQTFDLETYNKSKEYKFKLKELDIVPKLEEVKINRVKVAIQGHYELSKDARLLTLKLREITYPGKNLYYQFSFNPLKRYEDFGDKNTLNIVMPNGTNTLYIRGIDLDSKTATKYLKITTFSRINISKRVWFWPLMNLIALSPFLFYYFRFKLNKQKQEFQQQLALEQQRSKITADLHDEIGASLSSLQINSAVASFLIEKNPVEAQKILEKIESQSEHLSDKIGDIIWSMKPGKEEFLTLTSRIKNFANEMVGSTDINYKIKIDKKIDTVVTDISTRKNIVLFVKEATNNAIKYSKAKQLAIVLQLIENQVTIEISDDGVGFDTSITKGNGLGNMQKRIEELKGQFSITSEINLGTKIKATIPIVP